MLANGGLPGNTILCNNDRPVSADGGRVCGAWRRRKGDRDLRGGA
jgi:hypothetical protein